MFSKKNKEEKKQVTSSTSTSHVSQTSQTLVVRTQQQRSHSVSYSYNEKEMTPTGSQISLPAIGNNSLLSPLGTNRPVSSYYNSLGRTKTDAKPFVPANVNLNYQSPYRNSPVYSSWRTPQKPTTTTPLPRNIPKMTVSPPSKDPTGKIIVKKSRKFNDDGNSTIPTYKTSSKNRGEVLIINNVMFEGAMERQGAKVDDEKLQDMFKQMGFKVTVVRDLKCKSMVSKIEDFSKKSSLKSVDISIVVVMSHGTKNNTLGGTEVFGIDDKRVLTEDLLKYFTGDKCKNMAGKPKIFIFQCCRGDNEQFIQNDSRPIKPAVNHADMLIAYSTLPGFVSHRNVKNGTWYIQTLVEVFSQHAHEYHVEDMLKIVDVNLANFSDSLKQTSSYESRGFKRCYLHPV